MYHSCILIQARWRQCLVYKRNLDSERSTLTSPHTAASLDRIHTHSNMRFISVPLCALVLASLVVALPSAVRTSLLHSPSHDFMTNFFVEPYGRQAERYLDPGLQAGRVTKS